jgi:hypothetical protein
MMDEQAAISGLEQAARHLKEDLDSKQPSVAAETVWAYQDDGVRRAIAQRLIAGETLASRHVLMPDPVLHLHRVYFAFEPAHGPDETHAGILVQMREDFSVYEVLDPAHLPAVRVKDLEIYQGTFSLAFSRPIVREGRRSDRALSQFERFVRREGLEAAFSRRLRSLGPAGSTFGGLGGVFVAPGDFASGTCIETVNEYPGDVAIPVGGTRRISSWDVDYVEDDDA